MQTKSRKTRSVPKRLLLFLYYRIISPLGRIPERRLIKASKPKSPPIFIVGCPRSGTTVIYQSLLQSFKLSYFSNIVCKFFQFPVLTGRLLSPFGVFNPPPSYKSVLGDTKGWRSPNQGPRIWGRWFPRDGDCTLIPEWTDKTREEIAGTIAALENASGYPFINKWPPLSTLIPKLAETFPTAVFVCVRRDPLQTAQSILKIRLDRSGNPGQAVSRNSACHDELKHENYIDHVCSRVFGYNRDIDDAQKSLGGDRFYEISYEDFCDRPRVVMEDFSQWYKEKGGCELQPRRTIPERFKCSTGQKVSDEDLAALNTCITEYYDALNHLAGTEQDTTETRRETR